ncbi:hypothetical protein AYY17_13080 [Morganella psychrotolerans]|uniref:Uncharacterized protein n=1 Tax=Morganella psychrotolerans TaxID=368603 RepID=A0A1B8H0I1_9GAMM|nr:hypothetical protein AYY17_13080 [Morganella psychrotolerans]
MNHVRYCHSFTDIMHNSSQLSARHSEIKTRQPVFTINITLSSRGQPQYSHKEQDKKNHLLIHVINK